MSWPVRESTCKRRKLMTGDDEEKDDARTQVANVIFPIEDLANEVILVALSKMPLSELVALEGMSRRMQQNVLTTLKENTSLVLLPFADWIKYRDCDDEMFCTNKSHCFLKKNAIRISPNIQREVFKKFLAKLPNLLAIKITRQTADLLAYVMRSCPQLEHIDCERVQKYDEKNYDLTNMTCVRGLNLPDGLLVNCPKLKFLTHTSPEFPSEPVLHLLLQNGLIGLVFKTDRFPGAVPNYDVFALIVEQGSKLEVFDAFDWGLKPSLSALTIISTNLKFIRTFDIQGGLDFLALAANFPRLSKLSYDAHRRIDGNEDPIAWLNQFKAQLLKFGHRLRFFKLVKHFISNYEVAAIIDTCPSLKELVLSDNGWTGSSDKFEMDLNFTSLKHLTKLTIPNLRMSEMFLRGNLDRMPQLRTLRSAKAVSRKQSAVVEKIVCDYPHVQFV